MKVTIDIAGPRFVARLFDGLTTLAEKYIEHQARVTVEEARARVEREHRREQQRQRPKAG